MKCNGCWGDVEPKSQTIATMCGHLFCMKCAQQIIESDSVCPICQSMITKSNVKVVAALQEPSASKLSMCAQAPETALNSALASVNFYCKQMELYYEYREAQLKKKMQRVQEQCRQKLAEVHSGYQQAKQKYQEVAQHKKALEQDNQELQQKYAQKSMQARKLQEMVKNLKKENHQLQCNGSFHSGDELSPKGGMHIQHQHYRQITPQSRTFGRPSGITPDHLFQNGPNHTSPQQLPRPSGDHHKRRQSICHHSGRFATQNNQRKSHMFSTPGSPHSLRNLLGASTGSAASGGSGGPNPFLPGSPSGFRSF